MSPKAGTPPSSAVQLDLNSPAFQKELYSLGKEDQHSVMNTLAKLSKMTWQQVYADRGLNWEAVASRVGPHGGRLYSFRVEKGFRGVAFRQDDWLRILTLHPDHDSTYR